MAKKTREIKLGRELFHFTNFQDWVNTARDKYARSGHVAVDTVCIDSCGRICPTGKEFKRAETSNSFPIKVYEIA